MIMDVIFDITVNIENWNSIQINLARHTRKGDNYNMCTIKIEE